MTKQMHSKEENDLEVYKIETLGALDGPGIRTVIFLQGCAMRCGYCHNADSWFPGEGTTMSQDELFKRIQRLKPYYKASGGVTFSGGEPLLQARALLPFIMRLQKSGIHVALDTSGSESNRAALAVVEAVDLVILDFKANSDDAYQALTGHSWTHPRRILNYLIKIQKNYWIRQVIFPKALDAIESANRLDALTNSPYRQKLELLPYHKLGEEKWGLRQIKFKQSFL